MLCCVVDQPISVIGSNSLRQSARPTLRRIVPIEEISILVTAQRTTRPIRLEGPVSPGTLPFVHHHQRPRVWVAALDITAWTTVTSRRATAPTKGLIASRFPFFCPADTVTPRAALLNLPNPSSHTTSTVLSNMARHSESTLRDRMSNRPFAGAEADRERNSKLRAARLHGIAMCGEFVGTVMFLWFAFAGAQTAAETGGVANNASQVMLTSLAFGFSLLVNVWAFYRISGGLFNPAVGPPNPQYTRHKNNRKTKTGCMES